MNIKTRIKIRELKKKIVNKYYKVMGIIFKPLADYYDKRDKENYAKFKSYCEAMTDEELMRRFAKYLIDYMIKYSKKEHKFDLCHQRINGNGFSDFEDGCIIYELQNISNSCKDKYLKSFYYTTYRYRTWDDDFIDKENNLHHILKNELDKLGVNNYYEDNSSTYDEWWVKRTKYEKTLVIKLD